MEIAPPPGMPALVTSNLLILVATNVLFPRIGSDIVCTRKLGGIIHAYSRRAA